MLTPQQISEKLNELKLHIPPQDLANFVRLINRLEGQAAALKTRSPGFAESVSTDANGAER